MKGAGRTKAWVYAAAIVVGLGLGALVAALSKRRDLGLLGASWVVSAIMVIIGIVVLVMGWQVHRYVTTEPRRRIELKTITPERAVRTLVFAKALAVAGALLCGWYGGQALALMGHWDAHYYRGVIVECIIACVASLVDMVLGIVSEGLCRIPPSEGPEHPKVKARKRQQGLA